MPVGGDGDVVDIVTHVEDDVVVGVVAVVSVAKPVGGVLVYLHISHPQRVAHLHLGVEEVGARVGVGEARVDEVDGLSAVGEEGCQWQQAVLPYIMKESFHPVWG
jgi:hypothetical protein